MRVDRAARQPAGKRPETRRTRAVRAAERKTKTSRATNFLLTHPHAMLQVAFWVPIPAMLTLLPFPRLSGGQP